VNYDIEAARLEAEAYLDEHELHGSFKVLCDAYSVWIVQLARDSDVCRSQLLMAYLRFR
jgi:hypothetical protein